MSIKKSTTELKEEIKLNRWKSAKYKLLRNTKVTGRILHLLYPLILGFLLTYSITALVKDDPGFLMNTSKITEEESTKNTKIIKRDITEELESESKKSRITVYEKPELMNDGSYLVIKNIYQTSDMLSEKQLKAIKEDAKDIKLFDYEKAFGKPTKLQDELEKPKAEGRYIEASLVSEIIIRNYKNYPSFVNWVPSLLVALLFTIIAALFRRELEYDFWDRIESSINKAKEKSGLKRRSSDIKKELKARKKELRKLDKPTYKEEIYSKDKLYSICEEYAGEYEKCLGLGMSHSDIKQKFKYHGDIITKEENVYSSKEGRVLSSSIVDVNTSNEVKSENGLVFIKKEELFNTSDIDPQDPEIWFCEELKEYKNRTDVVSNFEKAIESGMENIRAAGNQEQLQDKAVELLGKSRRRKL